MSDPLETRLRHIRRRVRQVLWLYGCSWLFAVVIGATLAIGTLDWLLHLDDSGVRLTLGLGIVAGGIWVAWQFLIVPLLVRMNDVDIAMRIEQRFPGFKDSLASTVQFVAQQTDPKLGSPDLQQRVIDETMDRVARVDIADVVETRDVRRVAAVAMVICLLGGIIVGFNPAEAETGLKRLMFPFAAHAWPKQTELRLITEKFEPFEWSDDDPLRLARGDTLELFVENVKGNLPKTVSMQYRFADEEIVSEQLRQTTLRDDDGQSREVAVATLLVVKGPMKFRAIGGDDETEWLTLHVVPPPLVEDLHITLSPPAYTGRDVKRLSKGIGHVEGLVGTRVEIEAGVNKPLKSARLRVKDNQPQPIQISKDGKHISTTFVINESGVYSYWFELKDRQGFENSEAPRYEVRGIADLEPNVYIDKPSVDMQVTANALVPVRVVAKDDLGLKDIRLQYKLDDAADAVTIVLRTGDDRPNQLAVGHDWDLSGLSLVQGSRIVYHAEATDDYDLGPEHVGRSISRALTIVSPAEKINELASRQSGLLEELERVFKMQNRARDQVGELQLQLSTVGSLRPQDVDMLKRIELDQRQISARLLNPVDGIESRTDEMRSELKNNKLDDRETERRLKLLADELATLREESLPAIEQQLTQVRKAVEAGKQNAERSSSAESKRSSSPQKSGPQPSGSSKKSDDSAPSTASQRDEESSSRPDSESPDQSTSLDQVHEDQSVVLDSLDEMLGLLSQWQHRRDLTGEVDDIIAGQKAIQQRTAEIGKQTLGREKDRLSPQQQADLAKAANRQQQQAQRLEQLRKKIDETARELAGNNNAASETLRDAADQLDRQATSGRMREAARQLQNNQTGGAVDNQQTVLDELAELQDILRDRPVTDTEALIKKLKQAEQELEKFREQQQELLQKSKAVDELPDPQDRELELKKLTKQQQQLREEVSRLARRLRRLRARRPDESVRRATARMRQAEQQLANAAGEQAVDQQQEALDDLQQAQRELARQRREAEVQLARELLERIADELAGMIERQQQVVDETGRLKQEHTKRGRWSRALLKSLRNLADVQRGLQQETERLIETLKAAEVFALALQGAARQMQQAAERLDREKADDVTIALEQAAKQRFVDLIDALKSEKGGGDQQAGTNAGDNNGNGPQTDGIPALAQLKMLKTLQEDINRKTQQLDAIRRAAGGLTPLQQAEADALADEQGQLADLARNLTRAVTEAFETDKEETDGEDKIKIDLENR